MLEEYLWEYKDGAGKLKVVLRQVQKATFSESQGAAKGIVKVLGNHKLHLTP